MSTLDKLKKVALTGHSVTLAPQSIIEIADLLGEVRDAYSEAHKSAEFWKEIAEGQKSLAINLNDGWSKAIAERDNARTALAASAQGFAECIRHKDRLAEELTNLLADVDAINNALVDREWAEHCTTTQQGQTLEGFITELVGEVTELREKMKQPATTEAFRALEQRAEAAEAKLAGVNDEAAQERNRRSKFETDCKILRLKLAELEKQERGNDGWIEWKGGECPVVKGTLIDVRYRDGKEVTEIEALCKKSLFRRDASILFWKHHSYENDIIAYRIIPEQPVADLADLLPDVEKWRSPEAVRAQIAYRAAILRNIDLLKRINEGTK